MAPSLEELHAELMRRRDIDQEARRAMIALSSTDTAADREVLHRVGEIDRANTEWLREVVRASGWPRRSDVGDDGASAAWLLAQHADHDPAFQHECLAMMRDLPADEVRAADVAYLTDRVLLAGGERQIYGTQVTIVDDEHVPRDLRDPGSVDERRAAVGLGPLADYLRLVRESS